MCVLRNSFLVPDSLHPFGAVTLEDKPFEGMKTAGVAQMWLLFSDKRKRATDWKSTHLTYCKQRNIANSPNQAAVQHMLME
ncbi:hypothetical protein AMELA_G00101350 [Ameiurus melas]|uniref:Uncharacterized protein n=1 Tax=Ameiurus melas TaxID=219545 RepID=A0A7J6ASZ4_AMEME|nr:hypothetical protein AMELA_G00101350 [Ameiurus melas]